MAVGKWVNKQRRDRVRTEEGRQLRIRRTKNNFCPFWKIRIVAVKHRSGHERLRTDNVQAINFRSDLSIVRKIIKLRLSSRVSVLVRLDVESKVKMQGLETIEEAKFALAAGRSALLQGNGG